MLLMIGKPSEESSENFSKANAFFLKNLNSAKTNLTQDGEKIYIDSVMIYYQNFHQKASMVFNRNDFTLNLYLNEIQPLLHVTTEFVKNLITINQKALYQSGALLESSAQRAVMPGLVVIITSLIFTFIFTYLVHYYFVLPIIKLTKGINDYVKYNKPFDLSLETRDEIWSLKESVVKLISYCKSQNKK